MDGPMCLSELGGDQGFCVQGGAKPPRRQSCSSHVMHRLHLWIVSLRTVSPFQPASNASLACVNRQHLCPCELSDRLLSTVHVTSTVKPSFRTPAPPCAADYLILGRMRL